VTIKVSGAGEPVVLLHGVGLDHTMWERQVRALAGRHRVIGYDLLGHGGAAEVQDGANLDVWIQQLEALLRELHLERISLVGFSFGGMIAHSFAMKHAKMINRLVLMSTVYDRSEQEQTDVLARLELARRNGPQSIIQAAISRWFSSDFIVKNPDVIAKITAVLRSSRPESFLSAYACFAKTKLDGLAGFARPTLVMTGELDTGSTPAMAQRLAAAIPGARASIVPQGRHMMPVELAEEINSKLAEFLEAPGG
jgi:(E)-2-((N-methylformamido)methylene)succinate hydrolase